MEHFKKHDYIKKDGTIKYTLKNAIKHNNLDLPAKYEKARELVENIIINNSSGASQFIRDSKKEVVIKLKGDVLISPEFLELWGKIKYKTSYIVNFGIEALINKCVQDFQKIESIEKPKFITKFADMSMQNSNILSSKSLVYLLFNLFPKFSSNSNSFNIFACIL